MNFFVSLALLFVFPTVSLIDSRMLRSANKNASSFYCPDGEIGETTVLKNTVQPDGKFIVAGIACTENDTDFVIARFNTDGTVDKTFGNNGRIQVSVGSEDYLNSIFLQNDEKILFGGLVRGEQNSKRYIKYAIFRLNRDGSPDKSFGDEGKLIFSPETDNFLPLDFILQPDGKLIAGGIAYDPKTKQRSNEIKVVRYKNDGTFDLAFEKNSVDFNPGFRDFHLDLQSDGKVVISADTNTKAMNSGETLGLGIVRYKADGKLDKSYNLTGKLIFPHNSYSYKKFFPDGSWIFGKSMKNGFTLVRFKNDGKIDKTFGKGGQLSFPDDRPYDIQFQTDGKIILIGMTFPRKSLAPGYEVNSTIYRFDAEGDPDMSFGTNGKISGNIGGASIKNSDYMAKTIVLNKPNGDFFILALARFNNKIEEIGSTIIHYRNTGEIIRSFYVSYRKSLIILQSDGGMVFADSVSKDQKKYEFGLYRFNSNGKTDEEFGFIKKRYLPEPEEELIKIMPTPPPAYKPKPAPEPKEMPKVIAGGVLNGKAIILAKPDYPAGAKTAKANGNVIVQITIDEEGNVIEAKAVSGNELLYAAAEKAARESKFNKTLFSGQPVRVQGVLNFDFGLR